MANFTVKVCYPNWSKIASIVCHVVSYSSRTERLLTWQSWLKTGLSPTAVTSSENMATELTGPQPSWLSFLGSYAWTLQDISIQAKYHRRAEESLAVHMGRSAILNIVKNFELVWKLMGTDTLNTSWDKLFSQSFELVASDVFFWFQYKHYDENCDFHGQCFTL